MAILTNKQDVINNFIRYHGRRPNDAELAPGGVIEYLMTKPPTEVEKLLAKDSPITGGLIWSEYQKQQTTTTPTTPTTPSTTQPITTNPGIPEDIWNKQTPESQIALSAIGDVLQKQIDAGKTIPIALTPKDLADLWQQAENDPVIQKYYGDNLRMGGVDLHSSLNVLQGFWTQEQAAQQRQFVQEQKTLAENAASTGTAYSGLRGKAVENLKAAENDIVQSSRRTMQQNVTSLGTQFERAYGTQALQNQGGVNVGDINYSQYGGISGTQEAAKLGDVESRYQRLQDTSLRNQQVGSTAQPTTPTNPASTTVTPPTPSPTPVPSTSNSYGTGTWVNGVLQQPTSTSTTTPTPAPTTQPTTQPSSGNLVADGTSYYVDDKGTRIMFPAGSNLGSMWHKA